MSSSWKDLIVFTRKSRVDQIDQLRKWYNCNNPTNNLCLQDYSTNPDHLPVAVPLELLGIWTYAEEPTEKEEQMYDQYLARILPVPIYSPDLPQPHVLWHKLNTNMLRNMLTPHKFSIMGCSPDPEFYTVMKQTTEYYGNGGLQSKIIENGLAWEKGNPFGNTFGFQTDMGVVPIPDTPVHGYMCCPERGVWVIAACGG